MIPNEKKTLKQKIATALTHNGIAEKIEGLNAKNEKKLDRGIDKPRQGNGKLLAKQERGQAEKKELKEIEISAKKPDVVEKKVKQEEDGKEQQDKKELPEKKAKESQDKKELAEQKGKKQQEKKDLKQSKEADVEKKGGKAVNGDGDKKGKEKTIQEDKKPRQKFF
ncbi:unnamed protein product [Cylicostephanus goldi]|uniref:Uncharacterized protein n=1 Tax=Cylicostephanus goldi TaxID=71465 RepID=A0A3P6RY87_CYLGO|nr:unnamed protein product [Cylicostephanus goldi]